MPPRLGQQVPQPAGNPRDEHLQTRRFSIKRSHLNAKSELGPADYELRGWTELLEISLTRRPRGE